MKTTYNWVDKNEYPFESKYIDSTHGKMHYIDEGKGEVILFVHGNPNWSFGYRELIKNFSKNYRCIALDHIGFGLSDKPYDVSYLPQFHAANLEWFIEELGLKDITIVMHDWGGPISINYIERHRENVKAVIAFNSWFWSIKGVKTLEMFSGFLGSAFGRMLCKYFNFFPKVLLKGDVGDKSRFPKAIHEQYVKPFPSPKTRKGTWTFPASFLKQDHWLAGLWEKRSALDQLPALLLWGLKDKGFPEPFLVNWKSAFPENKVVKFDFSGHNSPEEIGKDAIPYVAQFLKEQEKMAVLN
ncbi:alpha/beta fold hydrolase [Chitinophaga sp. Hz27]|uniref:alpha/beta fold hydrolase n=1 Tax=Chitinophaga sp. Hz27 TaxID=3347169 RepID=UPI0035DC3BA8